MANATRTGVDKVSGGGIVINGSKNVFVNNIPASFLGSKITPHLCCGEPGCEIHCSATIITGSNTIFVNNIPVTKIGDSATCGDVLITGSPNVFFG
jgi:uncharacterized Zn-binding protein involved in type VI secretion